MVAHFPTLSSENHVPSNTKTVESISPNCTVMTCGNVLSARLRLGQMVHQVHPYLALLGAYARLWKDTALPSFSGYSGRLTDTASSAQASGAVEGMVLPHRLGIFRDGATG